MTDAQIVRRFIDNNKYQEVLALIKELGLSVSSVEHNNSKK